ncbi:hypothetical protein NQ317_016718 [Molorchus minor]|uniref:Uncharacterized protein n=1 Tax=Molorchus minor TaxID=1323400 RepID=A0ABQ9J5P4_9CUCU|nr:hypothetical protein NQ317_016718 [Molorchus minor]
MDNTPSCSSTFSGTDDITLSRLEQGSYLSFSSKHFSIDSTKTNVENFSKFLNSAGRLAFLNCDGPQCAENIKYCLKELGRSKNKEKYSFICCECNEVVEANENQNFWTSIQNHEHFEQRYCNFLAGEFNPMDVITDEMKNITFAEGCEILGCGPSTSNAEGSNENTDSGIDNENCEVDHNYAFPSNPLPAMSENSVSNKEDNARDNVNSFRFDFHLQYDKAIENKLYTQSLMKAIRRIDQVEEYTIQKTSPSRAVCLLCNCELLTRAKISKSSLLDHCMGQRHLKCASTPRF